jgi:hypothetical protein
VPDWQAVQALLESMGLEVAALAAPLPAEVRALLWALPAGRGHHSSSLKSTMSIEFALSQASGFTVSALATKMSSP